MGDVVGMELRMARVRAMGFDDRRGGGGGGGGEGGLGVAWDRIGEEGLTILNAMVSTELFR